MTGGRYSVVWTCRANRRRPISSRSLTTDFLARLQGRFGYRLGRLGQAAPRRAYPLRLLLTRDSVRERLVLIGNAAHTLHPVAGQGFNLGLRDVAALAEVLADSARQGGDPGSAATLSDVPPLAWPRSADDGQSDRRPGASLRRALGAGPGRARRWHARGSISFRPRAICVASVSWGLGGRLPRLARELSLEKARCLMPSNPSMSSWSVAAWSAPPSRPPSPAKVSRSPSSRPGSRTRDWPPGEIDLRVSALSRASQRILERLGVWERIARAGRQSLSRDAVWDAVGRRAHSFRQLRTWASPISATSSRTASSSWRSGSPLESADDIRLLCARLPLRTLSIGEPGTRLILTDGRAIDRPAAGRRRWSGLAGPRAGRHRHRGLGL